MAYRRPRVVWRLPKQTLTLGERTLLMGILNLAPDSFADNGRFPAGRLALTHGLVLLDEGADLLDLGAESTRPDSLPIPAAEEQERLLPTLRALRRARPSAVLSVDTYHAETALRALDAGADVINDVSGLEWDAGLLPALAGRAGDLGLVVMHTRGRPAEWSGLPALSPEAVVPLVLDGLRAIVARATAAGMPAESLAIDPGFGFGKRGAAENVPLLARLAELHGLGRPLLVGVSRKRFLGPDGSEPASEARLHATVAANTAAILAGAHLLRVHDVAAARNAAAIADRMLAAMEAAPADPVPA